MISCFLPATLTAQPPGTPGWQLLDKKEFNCKWIYHPSSQHLPEVDAKHLVMCLTYNSDGAAFLVPNQAPQRQAGEAPETPRAAAEGPGSVSDGLGLDSSAATFSHSCFTFSSARDLARGVVNLPRGTVTYAKANAMELIRPSRAGLFILMATEWSKNIFITATEG